MMSTNWKIKQHSSQQGIALLVVLLMLILISIIGVIAFRNSTTDLRLATASQISQVLFQANDAAFAKVEKEDRLRSTATATGNSSKGGLDTLQGYITRPGPEYVGAEVTFCVRPRGTDLFRSDKITEKNQNGDVLANINNGFCNPNEKNDYVSEGRVMTQLTFVKTGNDESPPLSQEGESDSSNDLQGSSGTPTATCTYFTGYAVSVLPSYSTASLGAKSDTGTTTVAGCMKQSMATIDKCLTDLQVPHNIQVQTYKHEPTGVECLK